MQGSRSYKSAIVIIPPERCWPQIQTIRKQYDKAFKRWMPHINLIYPFMEDRQAGTIYAKVATSLASQLSHIRPFTISFTKKSVDTFCHGRSLTMFVEPLLLRDELDKPISPATRQNQTEKVVTKALKMKAKKDRRQSPEIEKPRKSAFRQAPDLSPCKVAKPVPVPEPYFVPCPETAAGWESLASAIWTPETTPRFTSNEPPPGVTGIDALRFAFWTPGDQDSEDLQVTSGEDRRCAVTPAEPANWPTLDCHVDLTMRSSPDVTSRRSSSSFSSSSTSSNSGSSSSSSSSSDDDDDDPESENDDDDDAGRVSDDFDIPVDGVVHPSVMAVQSALELAYPGYNDRHSDDGFRPHLTLGQIRSNQTNTLTRIAETWEKIEFEVKEIYIISRPDDLNPFTIKKSIPLGLYQ